MMPRTLYHYCSGEAFLSIINSRSIRLTNLSLSNDSLEGKWASSLYENEGSKYKLSDTTKRLVESIIRRGAIDVFGFCLSEEKDILSQWRAYSDDGRGFCIGYNSHALSALCEAQSVANVLQFEKVEYESTIQRHIFNEFMNYCEKFADERRDIHLQIREKREMYTDATFLETASRIFLLKNPAFREEREWRLLALRAIMDTVDGQIYSDLRDLDYNTYNSLIRPFFTWDFDPNYYGTVATPEITEVVLGPKNGNQDYIIRSLLESKGLHGVLISRSNASYR
jgi:hypothetical protein